MYELDGWKLKYPSEIDSIISIIPEEKHSDKQ